MKPYPPVLREKRRYISFKVHAKMKFTDKQVKHSLSETVFEILGEKGVAESDFKVVEYNENMSGIIRTTHEMLENVIFALTLIKDVQGKNAWCQVLGTSGTIKTCREKYDYKEPNQKQKKKEKLEKSPSEIMKYSKK